MFSVTDTAYRENKQKHNLFDFTKKVRNLLFVQFEFNSFQAIEQRKLLATQQGYPEKCFLDYLLAIADENPAMFNEDDCAHEACTLMLAVCNFICVRMLTHDFVGTGFRGSSHRVHDTFIG